MITLDDRPREPHFAVHCEMQDAAAVASVAAALNGPAAASIELAKLAARFDTSIDDAWRADIILIGGLCFRLAEELEKDPNRG